MASGGIWSPVSSFKTSRASHRKSPRTSSLRLFNPFSWLWKKSLKFANKYSKLRTCISCNVNVGFVNWFFILHGKRSCTRIYVCDVIYERPYIFNQNVSPGLRVHVTSFPFWRDEVEQFLSIAKCSRRSCPWRESNTRRPKFWESFYSCVARPWWFRRCNRTAIIEWELVNC